MSGDGDTAARDPIDLLVERFLAARRTDSKLTVEAFAAAHAEHAAALLDLLPTIVALEDHKRERASSGSGRRRASVPQLERLGEFKITHEVGRGGMGVVFEAVQESLGRKVALKVLPQAALLTGNQLERFRREAQIAAQLHHSNIVPVFGSGESDGYHWYAMQFIVGQSLDAWRDEQTSAPPVGSGAWKARARFVARLGVQAAAALHYAHGVGTLHRDVKPGNLLLEPNDHLWVTDFGLAKALEAEGLTNSGDLLGTLQYMAPEQFAGSYDVRSEVYALGITLYELLTLRPAFAGSSRSELMERIRTLRPEPLRKLCPELPEDLAVVVEKAMARDPADRYRDAGELANDLQAFLEDRAIQARRLSAPALVWRWCRRNRGMAALAASTFLAVVGAGVTGWVAYGVTDDALQRAESSARDASEQAKVAAQQSKLAGTTLKVALEAFGRVFDRLVGPDPALALEEDEETGEQTVVLRGSVVSSRDVALLQEMLQFYGQFAEQNAGNQALQFETARANRRVGAIRARLGEPEDLTAAAAAYQQAITGLQQLTDRDVRRELAAVKVDLGRLEQRRSRPREAERLFLEALDTLPSVPASGGKGLRLDRANVNLLLAQGMLPRRPVGRPGGRSGGGPGAGPGGGPGGGRSPFGGAMSLDRERSRQARDHLQQAVALVDGLLAEEADNTEYRVMKARTLLLTARLHDRRFDGDRDRNERVRLFEAGVGTLREVVQAHPERDDYRFELIEALRESRVRWEPEGGRPRGERERPPERGPDRPPDRSSDRGRGVGDDELAVLREAKQHAERLLLDQPLVQEYRSLAAQVGGELGDALRSLPPAVAEPQRTARLQEAESVLVATMVALHESAGGQGAGDPRLLLQVSELQRVLADVYLAMGRRDDELTVLREARRTTDKLLREAPQVPELRAAVGGVALDLAESLRNVPAGAGEAERVSRLQEAEAVLVGVLSTLPESGEAPPAGDPRLLQQWLELRRMLAGTCLALGRRDDAVAQVQTVFDGIDRLVAALPKGDAPGVRRLVDVVEARLLMPFERLCDRLASPALQQRLAALRATLRERGGPR